jgi:hypothetical protein
MILIIGFNNLISKCTIYFTIHGDWMWNMQEKSITIVYLHWEQFFSFSSFLLVYYILSLQQLMMPFNASMKLHLNWYFMPTHDIMQRTNGRKEKMC